MNISWRIVEWNDEQGKNKENCWCSSFTPEKYSIWVASILNELPPFEYITFYGSDTNNSIFCLDASFWFKGDSHIQMPKYHNTGLQEFTKIVKQEFSFYPSVTQFKNILQFLIFCFCLLNCL